MVNATKARKVCLCHQFFLSFITESFSCGNLSQVIVYDAKYPKPFSKHLLENN